MKKLAQTLTECKNNDHISYHKFQSWFLQNLPATAQSSFARPKVKKVHACALENNDNTDNNMREEINVRAVDLKHEYH